MKNFSIIFLLIVAVDSQFNIATFTPLPSAQYLSSISRAFLMNNRTVSYTTVVKNGTTKVIKHNTAISPATIIGEYYRS